MPTAPRFGDAVGKPVRQHGGGGARIDDFIARRAGALSDAVRETSRGARARTAFTVQARQPLARIRVALRHKLQEQGEKPVFQTGELSVDLVKRIVSLAGKEIKLSPKEYEILRLLVQHAGKVLTHQYLLNQVWGGSTDVQYLRVYVRQLRLKIERTPDQPQYITTETGVGYRLREIE